MDAKATAPARPRRLFFTSQGRTAVIGEDGSGLRYFDFQKPEQVTWQPGPFFSDGRRVIFLSMEARQRCQWLDQTLPQWEARERTSIGQERKAIQKQLPGLRLVRLTGHVGPDKDREHKEELKIAICVRELHSS